MTTLTKTITENSSSTTTKSTWTITVTTGTPTLDGNNFKVDSPTVSAKYSGSNKGLASCYLIISFPSGTYTLTKEYSDSCGGSMHAWASGTTETLSAVNGVSHYSLPVSRYFSSSSVMLALLNRITSLLLCCFCSFCFFTIFRGFLSL